MKLIFKWLRPIESQQSTISGCKITSYFLNFQIFSHFSLGARKHWEYNCFPIEDITIYPLRVSLFSPIPDIPNFLSYAYHLLNRPCPSANIGSLPHNSDECLSKWKYSSRTGIIDSGRCPILCPFTYRMGLTKYIETCRWQEEVACGIRWPGRVRDGLNAVPKMRGIYPIICPVGCRCIREPGDFCTFLIHIPLL